jgi:glutamate/tyrosine decarboxylase-like PLP-dependent enzyme
MDDMIDHLAGAAAGPVWRPMPDWVRAEWRDTMAEAPVSPEAAYRDFQRLVAPYATGNTHPRFMGWVHGGGNAMGMLAELLAAGLNANLGGRDHAPIEVERQVIRWAAARLGLPETAGGLLVTGTSMANFIAVLVARAGVLPEVRTKGLRGAPLTAYSGAGAHACLPQAMDMAGLGSDALRLVALTSDRRIDLAALAEAVARDRAAGASPFLVAATAGSVDTGSIDDLVAIASFCRAERLWFHVDAAFGAFAALSPRLRPLVAGLEQADSVAFDFHKWGQVPYDAGCILVRDQTHLLATFAQDVAYLRQEARGLAGNPPWPCDLGPDLSRGFRALKVWMTLKVYGAARLGLVAEQCCDVAQAIAALVAAEPGLELMAPVALNIVCFRVRAASDADQREIVADLQESGIVAPSTTQLDGRTAIRAAIVNHRTTCADAAILVEAVLRAARCRLSNI